MNPDVPPHITHHHTPGKMKGKPTLSGLINANSRSAYGVAAMWLHGKNDSRTSVILCGICKTRPICLLLWNSLSRGELVTLSVGFASFSSQEKKVCTLESLLMGAWRNKEKTWMPFSGYKWETRCIFFRYLLRSQLSCHRGGLPWPPYPLSYPPPPYLAWLPFIVLVTIQNSPAGCWLPPHTRM